MIKKRKLNWKKLITGFEIALINGFITAFQEKYNNLIDYGCYFHYLQICIKRLKKKGYTVKKEQ